MLDQSVDLKNSNHNTINQTLKYSSVLDDFSVNFNLLEKVINEIYTTIDCEDSQEGNGKNNYKRDIKKKNKINKLSQQTYDNIIKENVDEYFEIKAFLTNPINKDIKKKYLAIRNTLYPTVIAAIDEGKTMDEVLSNLNSKFSQFFNSNTSKKSDESFIYCSGFFYYMYYICDIGKNE